MKNFLKKLIRYNETKLFALLLLVAVLFAFINPEVFTLANLYALIRSSSIQAIFALAIMIVMCCGAFDMSYAMIGAFGSYILMFVCVNHYPDAPLLLIFAGAIVISVVLELFNWVLIDRLKLQPYIATLGTQSILKGMMLAFISTKFLYTLPNTVQKLGTTYLHTAYYGNGVESQLHICILFVIVMYIIMHIVMTYTNFGRQVYAIGADDVAASRAGINVSKVRLLVFIIAGVICGIGGVLHDAVGRCSLPVPSDLVGKELTSIAAVILGTANSSRARGSVLGTLLGVMLLEFISGNLILIGIPSFYTQLASGLLVFAGMIIQMSSRPRKARGRKEAAHNEA